MGVNLTLKQLTDTLDRHPETIKAVAVFAGVPHCRVGYTLLFPGAAADRLREALKDFDIRQARLHCETATAMAGSAA